MSLEAIGNRRVSKLLIRCIASLLIVVFISMICLTSIAAFLDLGYRYDDVADVGYLTFTTTSTKAQSGTAFRTIGFTAKFSTYTTTIKMEQISELDNGDGTVTTYFRIPFTNPKNPAANSIMKRFKDNYIYVNEQDEIDNFFETGGIIHLDAIFTIMENGVAQGGMDYNGVAWGETYNTEAGIKAARAWSDETLNDFWQYFNREKEFPAQTVSSSAKAEFEILHNNQNKTDGTITISGKPYYIDLTDRSIEATSWQWYIKTPAHSDYTPFSTEQNPKNVEIWQEGITQIKLVINNGTAPEHTKLHSITAILSVPPDSPPMLGIDANPKTVYVGQSYTVIDASQAVSPATSIVEWEIKEEFIPEGSSIRQTIQPTQKITAANSFFKSYSKTAKGNYIYTLTYAKDNKGKTVSGNVSVTIKVVDIPPPTPTPSITPTPSVTPTPTPTPVYQPPHAAFDIDGTYSSETVFGHAETVINSSVRLSGRSTTPNQTIEDETIRIRLGDRYGVTVMTIRFMRQPDGQYMLWYSGGTGTFKIDKESSSIIGGRYVDIQCLNLGTYYVMVDCTDNRRTCTDYAMGDLVVNKVPPATNITTPTMCFPKEITEFGGPKNLITWDYTSSTNTPYKQSYVKVILLNGDGTENSVVLETNKTERSIYLVGNANEKYKIVVKVQDTGDLWSSEVSESITIITPVPYVTLTGDDLAYLGFPMGFHAEIDTTTYPHSMFEQYLPSHYTRWEILDLYANVVQSGSGKIPDELMLNESVEGYTNYIARQFAGNGIAESQDRHDFYTISAPAPAVNLMSMSTYIDEYVSQTITITQPKPEENFPDSPQVFDETNCHYKILNPDGSTLVEADGIFAGIYVGTSNGFMSSTEQDIFYRLIQTATNTWGLTGTGIVDLIVKKTPKPEVYVGVPNTYIDETVPVERTIVDVFDTPLTAENSGWKIEELSGTEVVRQVDSGGGLLNSIVVTGPKYEENKSYRLTQHITNKKGIESYGACDFRVYEATIPQVQVIIKERDADPGTSYSTIYPKESLDIETIVNPGIFTISSSYWDVQSKAGIVLESGTGQLNGLKQLDLLPGEYRIVQYATNNKGKTGSGYVVFHTQAVSYPIVNIVTALNGGNPANNVVYIGNKIHFKSDVRDPNKSEEHPQGYPLNSVWAIKDPQGNDVGTYRKNEAADTDITITKELFEQGKQYTLRQYTENSVFGDKNAQQEVGFIIGNNKPQVMIDIEEGDGVSPLFTDETVTYHVTVTDADGVIKTVNFYVDDGDYTGNANYWLESAFGEGLDTSTYTATFKFIGKNACNPEFRVVAMDDAGEVNEYRVSVFVLKPALTAEITIKDESSIQKKQNRYIELDLTNSHSDAAALYPIDPTKTQLEYISPDGQRNAIPEGEDFNDENIRVHYPNYPDKSIVSIYFKKLGNYKLYAKVYDVRGNHSEFAEKVIQIEEDMAPQPDFSITTPFYRITEDYIRSFESISSVVNDSNIGKAFFIYNTRSMSPDGDELDRKEIYLVYDGNMNGTGDDPLRTITLLQDPNGIDPTEEIVQSTSEDAVLKVKDLNDFKLTFLSDEKDLGNYYFQTYVKEKITQLPEDPGNPLTAELLELQKSARSESMRVFIDNKAPRISFEVETGKSINLIIHFDLNPTPEQEAQINELINTLQQRGIKVNVIKNYNVY